MDDPVFVTDNQTMTPFIQYLLPWEFSPAVALFCLLAAGLYLRGWLRCRHSDQPVGYWPLLSYMTGIIIVYLVMQTWFDYLSQHMLWIHRLQHLVLHHLGPFLMMLGAPLKVLPQGVPEKFTAVILTPLWRSAPVRFLYALLQNVVVAPLLFVGLIYFWLLPDIHFTAMLSASRYQLMNWSMLLDALLFWWLILDPRPRHAAGRLGYGARIVILTLIVPPQILIGAHMALAKESLFSVYNVCGRAWPISPLVDQQIAGLITWIPASMMSVIAVLLLIRRWSTENREAELPTPVVS